MRLLLGKGLWPAHPWLLLLSLSSPLAFPEKAKRTVPLNPVTLASDAHEADAALVAPSVRAPDATAARCRGERGDDKNRLTKHLRSPLPRRASMACRRRPCAATCASSDIRNAHARATPARSYHPPRDKPSATWALPRPRPPDGRPARTAAAARGQRCDARRARFLLVSRVSVPGVLRVASAWIARSRPVFLAW